MGRATRAAAEPVLTGGPGRARVVAVPWCDECETMVDDDQLGEDGTCPTCGDDLLERRGTPWHFKVIGAGTAIYLVYRLVQGILWLIHHA